MTDKTLVVIVTMVLTAACGLGSGAAQNPTSDAAVGNSGTRLHLIHAIALAYGVRVDRIVSAPDWVGEFPLGLAGKVAMAAAEVASAHLGDGQHEGALRQLLAEQLELRVHKDRRQYEFYYLKLEPINSLNADGIRTSVADCVPFDGDARQVPATASPHRGPACGLRIHRSYDEFSLEMGGITVSELAAALEPLVGRAVVDRTGLAGRWDVELSLSREQMPGPLGWQDGAGPGNEDMAVVALNEQLGLTLVRVVEDLEVIVVDFIKRPSGAGGGGD